MSTQRLPGVPCPVYFHKPAAFSFKASESVSGTSKLQPLSNSTKEREENQAIDSNLFVHHWNGVSINPN